MIVHDLSNEALAKLVRVDLATLEDEPESPVEAFEFHGCTWGAASFVGAPPWEQHTAGDELLHILDGKTDLTVIEGGESATRTLKAGTVAVVPKGSWHRNEAPEGVTMIYITPNEGTHHSWQQPT